MNNRYYCFPDIHGEYKLLKKALDFVYLNNPDGGKIIFLGDYIDRGTQNVKVLEVVMNPPEKWEFVCLTGNHEQMFIDSYIRRMEFYDMKTAREIALFDKDDLPLPTYDQVHYCIPKNIIEWMYGLKLFHFEGPNVFAHATYDDSILPEQQSVEDVVWKRYDDWMKFTSQNDRLYLTHGHTPRKHGPVKSPNRVNLDCGPFSYGRYVIGEYEYNVKGPVDFHEFMK
jgi:serine/threonine protein phosphatase 1